MTFHQQRSWPHVHTEAKAQSCTCFRTVDQHFAPRSTENWPHVLGAVSTAGRALLLGTLWGGGEHAQAEVFADIWKELWKSPEIQWFPVKHFLTHHLEFDYEVNRLEFCTRDVIFPLPLVSSAIKTCLSALSNDNDKCSRGKRCHEKHTKDFSEEKKNLNPTLNFISEEKLCSVGGRKWNACCPAEALIDRDLQELGDLAISTDFRPNKERLLEEKENQNTNSECWLSMAQWSIWLDLIYLVPMTSITPENSHTNDGQRHLFTNVLGTESRLKILALLGEGNWQSLVEAEGRSCLKDATEQKQACRGRCCCRVPLVSRVGCEKAI